MIDLLIYAHDGRGLGHVSRSVAIGLAVRRLFPEISVLLVTGCSAVAELVGRGDLDWIKLPSYKTSISEGRSSGTKGPSNIDDKLLGELRGRDIRHILETYRPGVFLADHTPQGKHRELIPSHAVSPETVRVLGVRAVVGDVDKVWSDFSAEVFNGTYENIIWYGDSSITGPSEVQDLSRRYGVQPFEAGYVSRFAEMEYLQPMLSEQKTCAGVVSVPWSGEGTYVVLDTLAGVLSRIDASYGTWKIYMNLREECAAEVTSRYAGIEQVSFSQVGPDFFPDLACSRSAIIYGGYNSLTDIMACGVPSVVLLRGMKDGEQEEHASVLARSSSSVLDVFPESGLEADMLERSLRRCLDTVPVKDSVNLNGAENAARHLVALAGGGKC